MPENAPINVEVPIPTDAPEIRQVVFVTQGGAAMPAFRLGDADGPEDGPALSRIMYADAEGNAVVWRVVDAQQSTPGHAEVMRWHYPHAHAGIIAEIAAKIAKHRAAEAKRRG